MAKNRIGSGDIERRLGRTSSSGGSSRGPDDPRSDDGSSNGNVLFGFAFAIILVVGSGALAASDAGAGFRQAFWEEVMGPPPEPVYQSRVAPICEKGWQDVRDNADQIHCYMTTDVGRLCDPRERRAMADKLVAYQLADDRLIGSAATTFLTGYAKSGPADAVKMGMAEAKSRDPNLSEQERAEQLNKVSGMAQRFNAPTMQVLEEGSKNSVGIVTILHDVRDLAEQGYLSASDFTAKMPKTVKDGIAEAHSISPSPCRTR